MCVRHLTPEMPARNPGQPHLWGNFFTHKERGQILIALQGLLATLFLDVGPGSRVHSAHGRNLSEGTFVRCIS